MTGCVGCVAARGARAWWARRGEDGSVTACQAKQAGAVRVLHDGGAVANRVLERGPSTGSLWSGDREAGSLMALRTLDRRRAGA